MSATLLGLGVVAPGAPDCAALERALAAPGPLAPPHVELIPDGGDPKTRRLPRLERMALAAARQALVPGPAVEAEGLALVFGTGYGGLGATADFLEGMASRGAAFGSPTAFHQSVHHSPAGQLSIALGLRGASLTVSARELSGETALQVALDLLASGRARRVLVVAADERTPSLEAAYRAFAPDAPLQAGEGAAALLLGTEEGPLRLEALALSAHPCAPLHFARPEQLAPLLRRELAAAGPQAALSPAAPTPAMAEAEGALLDSLAPGQPRWADAARFGFHPSAGLLRAVASALRLRAQAAPASCLLHGLALGGGQALVRLRHG